MSRVRDTVTLNFATKVILKELLVNFERYKESYEAVKEAYKIKYDAYRELHVEWTTKRLKGVLTDEEEEDEPVSPHLPTDRTDIYELYMAMLTTTTEEEVELTPDMFSKLVLDKWEFITRHITVMRSWAREIRAGGTASMADSDSTAAALMALDSSLVDYGVED